MPTIHNLDHYIGQLTVRVNLITRNGRYDYRWHVEMMDRIDLLRHDLSEGLNVEKAALAVNRKLCTVETSRTRGRKFIRSAQSRASYTRPAAR